MLKHFLFWVAYALPLLLVLRRAIVLEARSNAYFLVGMSKEKAHPHQPLVLLLGLVPVVNIPLAWLVTRASRREKHQRGYIKPCLW